jgi:seryl-tRNA synthetase
VAELRPATAEQAAFLDQLLESGFFVDSGVPGIYGRSGDFEHVRTAFDGLVDREAADEQAELLRFPPVLPRRQLEASGFLKSFPHLAGAVFAFQGSEAEAAELQERAERHEDWSEFQSLTELVLTPAACYPVYPAIAMRGPVPAAGLSVDAGGAYTFRAEPSGDPARLQAFHQRERVRFDEPAGILRWVDEWRGRGLGLLRRLGLEATAEVAADPFFGRGGRMLAASQREQRLKFEILVEIAGPEPTAVASFNNHQDHFATAYALEREGGGSVHTGCFGFGHERIVLALLREHGFDLATWPEPVRRELWP